MQSPPLLHTLLWPCLRSQWMSSDDLGVRASAAAEQAGAQEEGEGASGRAGAPLAHPTDPYAQEGSAPPRPDDFHEDGDGLPPSSSFPA